MYQLIQYFYEEYPLRDHFNDNNNLKEADLSYRYLFIVLVLVMDLFN